MPDENKNESPEESLFKAVRENDSNLVKSLLEKGVNVNAKDKYGATAFMWAIRKESLEIAKLLLTHGAKE